MAFVAGDRMGRQSHKMKIWFPMSQSGTGSEIITRQLAANLAKSGIETVVSAYSPLFELSTSLLTALKLRPPPGTSLIHANAATAEGFDRYGIPTVLTAHGAFERAEFDPFKRNHQRFFHSRIVRPGIMQAVGSASSITAVSQWVSKVYQQEYSAKQVEVIHNWIDPDIFYPVNKPRAKRLLFVGRATWQKGSQLLPELSRLLGNNFELTSTLDDDQWDGEVPSNVHLIGPVARRDMHELYRSHDALLVPSISEGFCLAAAEAMACGLPVFGFRGHGLDDVMGPFADRCSVEMLDLQGLANCVQRVFDDSKTYDEISARSSEYVRNHFTPEVALEKYIALYGKITSLS